jgi:hypothetical protein
MTIITLFGGALRELQWKCHITKTMGIGLDIKLNLTPLAEFQVDIILINANGYLLYAPFKARTFRLTLLVC